MLHVMTPVGVREMQATLTRERILGAVADLLERGGVDELTMAEVADASGVSLRTVYRCYPTRDALLEAAGRWIGNELLEHRFPRTLDEVADLYEQGCADFDERPGLVRALALSHLGQQVRGVRRRERVGAIRTALRNELTAVDPAQLAQAEAVLSYLHNMLAYTVLRDENGLSGEEIGAAVGWAIRTLVADLRKQQKQAMQATKQRTKE